MVRIVSRRLFIVLGVVLVVTAQSGYAQTIGTFRWQTQPFCNLITVTISIAGPAFRLEGTDDHCGAATKASVIGMAFPNADGSIGLGLTIVSPGAAVLHLDATILLNAGFNGTWHDTVGRSGTWSFTAGAGTPGPPRPVVGPVSYGAVFTQPSGAPDRGFSAVVTTDTGPDLGDAAAVHGRFGGVSAFTLHGSAGIRGDSAEGIGVMGTSNSGWGVVGGAASDGIAVQAYAEGTNSVGVKAIHAAGGTALEIDNGAIKVTGTTRAAFSVQGGFSQIGCVIIDHPLLNGDPQALIFTTSSGPSVTALYSGGTLNKWCLSSTGATFTGRVNVLVIKQ